MASAKIATSSVALMKIVLIVLMMDAMLLREETLEASALTVRITLEQQENILKNANLRSVDLLKYC